MVATSERNLRRTPLERWTPCAHKSMQVGPGPRHASWGAGHVAQRQRKEASRGAVSCPLKWWPEQFRFRSQAGTAPSGDPESERDPFPSAPGFIPAQPHCRSLPFLPLRRFHSLPLNLTPAGRAPTLTEYTPACGGGGERS